MKPCVLWVLAVGCARPAPATVPSNTAVAPPEPSVAGLYRDHDDELELRELPGGELRASIATWGPNGHSCSFEGDLAPNFTRAEDETPFEGRRWTFADDSDETGLCHLDVIQTEHEVRIIPKGCRYYCGVRASLETTFAFPPARPRRS